MYYLNCNSEWKIIAWKLEFIIITPILLKIHFNHMNSIFPLVDMINIWTASRWLILWLNWSSNVYWYINCIFVNHNKYVVLFEPPLFTAINRQHVTNDNGRLCALLTTLISCSMYVDTDGNKIINACYSAIFL